MSTPREPFIRIPIEISPEALAHLAARLQHTVYLCSSGQSEHSQDRYDIFSAFPQTHITIEKGCADSQAALQQWLSNAQKQDRETTTEPADLPFVSGLMGYCSYEWAAALHLDKPQSLSQSVCPLLYIGYYSWSYVYDHHTRRGSLNFSAECGTALRAQVLQIFQDAAQQRFDCTAFTPPKPWRTVMSAQQYHERFCRAQAYILQGDVYQINLTQRLETSFTGDSAALFQHYRNTTRTPYSAFLHLGQAQILSFSPEQFIAAHGQHIQSKPIKGTLANQGQAHEAEQLSCHAKNRAENVMIVDLMRNDLSGYCERFSVKVPKLCAVESFRNVHHLVSTIVGQLRPDVSALEAFLGSLPGGSITGAPKRRAIEIIDELEIGGRDAYCGSVFYASDSGRFDSNILIRTIVRSDEQLFCWGGGGIVADSVADEEYAESLLKVQNLTGVRSE